MADFKRNPLWGYSPEKYRTQSWGGDVSDNLALIYAPLQNKVQRVLSLVDIFVYNS